MVRIKLKLAIHFDGKQRTPGEELEITPERFSEMRNNFKNQKLKIENYLDVLEITKQTKKRKK